MLHNIMKILVFPLFCCLIADAWADENAYINTRVVSTNTAYQIALAAEKDCKKMGYQVSVAVVDRYGNLLSFIRDPLSGAHTITVAQNKAYTAATFQEATIDLAGRVSFMTGTPRISLIGGGIPIKVGGYMYGAVGVSGAPAKNKPGDVDHSCAMKAVDAVRGVLEFAD